MTDKKKLSRRDALTTAAGGALSLAAALALVEEAHADDTYSEPEIVRIASDFFGMTTAAVAKAVSRIFDDLGRPNAYITGEEASGAIAVGLRYGSGHMNRKGYKRL